MNEVQERYRNSDESPFKIVIISSNNLASVPKESLPITELLPKGFKTITESLS